MAKTPKHKPASQVPEELQAVVGSHVFVSREREVTQFEFDGLRPALLMDGRLAWQTTAKHADSLMNHHFIVGQRILYVGEGDNEPHTTESAEQPLEEVAEQVAEDATDATEDATEDSEDASGDAAEQAGDQTSDQTSEG